MTKRLCLLTVMAGLALVGLVLPAAGGKSRPLNVIYYCSNGCDSLMKMLRGTPGQHFVFIDAPANNKSGIRGVNIYDWAKRKAGPTAHPVVEVHLSALAAEQHRSGMDWAEVGAGFRESMAQVGMGLSPPETWAINEAGSAIRKSPLARQNLANLIGGLYGAPGFIDLSGIVFQQGVGSRNYFRRYQQHRYQEALAGLFSDDAFWSAVDGKVRYYAYETYAAPADWMAWSPRERRDYLFGPVATARQTSSVAATVVPAVYVPVLNAYWRARRGYGDTNVPLKEMRAFVASQVEAARAAGCRTVAFAWNQHPRGATVRQVLALAKTIAESVA